jgi:hypothetical protein
MRALIDGDLLVYECSAVAEYPKDEPISNFDFVIEVFHNKLRDMLKAVDCTDYTMYLTGKNNFRNQIAVTKPYKGNRKGEKPFHYHNLRAYIMSLPDSVMIEGMEADDALAINQTEDTIICSRDKDLRMVAGWHYGWESGQQGEFGPFQFTKQGQLQLSENKKKLTGGGLMFFYSQLLTGDSTDNIPGLKGYGPAKAFDILCRCTDEYELFDAVSVVYEEQHQDKFEEYMLEQGRLLWMVNELNEDGSPVMWELPMYVWKPEEGLTDV